MAKRTVCVMGRILDQDDGLGVYSLNLLRSMMEQDPDTHYAILLKTDKNADLFKEYPNAETVVLSTKSKTIWDQFSVPAAAKRLHADIIFNPKFSIPFFTKIDCAFVLQGSDWYVNPQNYEWWDNLYIRLTLPLYIMKAKKLLAISQSTVDDLLKHIRFKREKATVTYASVSSHFTTERDESALARFKDRYKLPEHFILTVARAYHTGHPNLPPYPGGNNERLLQGYLKYRQQGGDIPLVVVGYKIKEYLLQRGFTDADLNNVHFTGFISHDEIYKAYQLADSFILATLCESFGFPIVEAFASGCPAIVPSTCASPEVAGDAARLIDPFSVDDIANALNELSSSNEVRLRMRERGLERAKQLSWHEVARRTLEVFDDMTRQDS